MPLVSFRKFNYETNIIFYRKLWLVRALSKLLEKNFKSHMVNICLQWTSAENSELSRFKGRNEGKEPRGIKDRHEKITLHRCRSFFSRHYFCPKPYITTHSTYIYFFRDFQLRKNWLIKEKMKTKICNINNSQPRDTQYCIRFSKFYLKTFNLLNVKDVWIIYKQNLLGMMCFISL